MRAKSAVWAKPTPMCSGRSCPSGNCVRIRPLPSRSWQLVQALWLGAASADLEPALWQVWHCAIDGMFLSVAKSTCERSPWQPAQAMPISPCFLWLKAVSLACGQGVGAGVAAPWHLVHSARVAGPVATSASAGERTAVCMGPWQASQVWPTGTRRSTTRVLLLACAWHVMHGVPRAS